MNCVIYWGVRLLEHRMEIEKVLENRFFAFEI